MFFFFKYLRFSLVFYCANTILIFKFETLFAGWIKQPQGRPKKDMKWDGRHGKWVTNKRAPTTPQAPLTRTPLKPPLEIAQVEVEGKSKSAKN